MLPLESLLERFFFRQVLNKTPLKCTSLRRKLVKIHNYADDVGPLRNTKHCQNIDFKLPRLPLSYFS